MLAHQQPAPQRARTVDADGTVEGYASLFGVVDSTRDMMLPGAFARTLERRAAHRVPLLFQHDPSEPIGVWLDLKEDARGLRVRGRLIPGVQRAREVLALVKAGALDGLSIGFRTVRSRVDPATRVRRIHEVDLWEVSIVTFPLLAGARVSATKDRKYSPDQPRVPAGNPDGGQWTSGGGAGALAQSLTTAADQAPRSDLRQLQEIANDPAIRRQIDEAWTASNPEGIPQREHGFWISRNVATGELFTRPFANPGTDRSIVPGTTPSDAIAFFHTHP